MPKKKYCAAPKCDSARSENPRRYVYQTMKNGKTRRLHVCRACYERRRDKGTYKRTESRWAAIEQHVVAMRKRGKGIAEIVAAFPGLPRRSAYAICTRHGLAGTWGYEIGQGGRRSVG